MTPTPIHTPWDPAAGTPQMAELRRALERESMVTAWWSEVAGARTAEHAHPFPETTCVVTGFLRVTAAGRVYDLGPGDRLDLPAGTRYAVEVIGLSPVVYVTGTTDRMAAGAPALP